MGRGRTVLLFALVVAAVASGIVGVSGAVGADTTSPAETTTTPQDGPDGHADDPFPSWLPLLLAGGLLVGIAVVGGSLWFVVERIRRLTGK
jgi:hypothetical protein